MVSILSGSQCVNGLGGFIWYISTIIAMATSLAQNQSPDCRLIADDVIPNGICKIDRQWTTPKQKIEVPTMGLYLECVEFWS